MSTDAMIVFQNSNDICFGVAVNFDGYIEGGVGETLFNYWNDEESIKDICVKSNKSIRSFGTIMSDIEYYDDIHSKKLSKSLKYLTKDEMLNKAGNFDYTYIWKESEKAWYVIHPKFGYNLLKIYIS